MKALDEDALICDFAQYYGLFDYMSKGLQMAAILACGLPADSRIMKILQKRKYSIDTIMQASILDTVRSFEYAFIQRNSKDRIERPKSVVRELLGIEESENGEMKQFETAEEYEKEMKRIKGEK